MTGPPSRSTPEERAAWFTKWASENPKATVNQGREALRAHFGGTMGSERIATILRNAKEAAGIGRPSIAHSLLGSSAAAAALTNFVEQMRSLGIKLTVTLTEENYRLEIEGKLPRTAP